MIWWAPVNACLTFVSSACQQAGNSQISIGVSEDAQDRPIGSFPDSGQVGAEGSVVLCFDDRDVDFVWLHIAPKT